MLKWCFIAMFILVIFVFWGQFLNCAQNLIWTLPRTIKFLETCLFMKKWGVGAHQKRGLLVSSSLVKHSTTNQCLCKSIWHEITFLVSMLQFEIITTLPNNLHPFSRRVWSLKMQGLFNWLKEMNYKSVHSFLIFIK